MDFLFALLWLLVGWLSALDAYLNMVWPVHSDIEKNPLARWLLVALREDAAAFLGVKFAGTILALGILVLWYRYRTEQAVVIAAILVVVQSAMLLAMIHRS